MELVISSGTNNERYIVETNSILAELDKKLKGLGSQYTTIIQNKNEIIAQKDFEISTRNGLIKFAAKALRDLGLKIEERYDKISSQDEMKFLFNLVSFIAENIQALARAITQNKSNDAPK